MQRRDEDKCLAKRLWNTATPYIQMGGWLIIAVPVILTTGQLLQEASAYGTRLNDIQAAQSKYEAKTETMNQKLDLLIYLMKKK